MIAEILLLQQLLGKINMVTPPDSPPTTATSTYGKAEAATKDYLEKARSYLRGLRG
tara:strand:+ start:213 stop:380 length:168 start_codon:yes stop_codon:yes gene_type:complete